MMGSNSQNSGMMMSWASIQIMFSNPKREFTWLRDSIVVREIATRVTCPIEGCVWDCEWVETEFWHCQWCWWMTACVSVDMLRTLVKWLGLPINMDQTSAGLGESMFYREIWHHSGIFQDDIDGLMQERRHSIANALELRLSCTNSSIFNWWNMVSGKKCLPQNYFLWYFLVAQWAVRPLNSCWWVSAGKT